MVRQQTRGAARAPYRFFVTLVALGLGSLPAQPPTGSAPAGNAQAGGTPDARPQSTERVFLDGVMMTVDTEVILYSEVQEDFDSLRIGKLNRGEKLTPLQERQLFRDVMRKFQHRAVQSRAALSIKGVNPDQIQDYVDRLLRETREEDIKAIGSHNKMKEEMSLLDNSVFMIERKRKEAILFQLSEQELHLRMRDRASLMITPRMLRDRYRKVQATRRTDARADLGLVRFALAPDADAARKSAAAAATAWRQGDKTSKEIAAEFGGGALADRTGLTDSNTGNLQPFLVEFVAKAKASEVSDPIEQGGALWVLKLLNRQAGTDYRFDDPVVQDQLRRELLLEEYAKIKYEMTRRDWQKVFIWEARQGRRAHPIRVGDPK